MHSFAAVAAPLPAGSLPSIVGGGGVAFATRGVGELAAADALPPFVVSVFGALTYLGDPWACLFAVSLAYVVGTRSGIARPSSAFVLGLGLGAVGLTVGLKELFALPRPPGAFETGYGFPSGHALGTTVFWGGVALLADAGRRRVRLAFAAAVVALVAASRVVIGVHYLADVAAGVAVGVGFLAAVVGAGPGLRRAAVPSNRAVVACYLLGGLLATMAAVANPVETEVLLAVGTAAAGAVVWSRLADTTLLADGGDSPRSAAVGAVAVPVPLAAMLLAAELSLGVAAVVLAGAAGGVALLSLPVVASSLVG